MIEVIKTSIAAGETKNFLINGGYFEVLECAYPIDVLLMDKQGSQRSILKSAEASYFNAPGAFEVIQITSAQAQDVRFFVGDGQAGTRRVAGVVSVVDGGRARTMANESFQGVLTIGAAAGLFSHVGLKNPAGSGKNLIVKAYRGSVGNVNDIILGAIDANPLATDAMAVNSKKSGGAGSVGRVTTEQAAALRNSILNSRSEQFYSSTTVNVVVSLQEPIVLTPGYSLIFSPITVNNGIAITVEFTQESI